MYCIGNNHAGRAHERRIHLPYDAWSPTTLQKMLFYDVIKDTHVNISVSEAAGGANSDGWNHSSKRQRLAHNHTYSSKPSYPDEASCESSEDAYRSQCRSGNGTWLSVSTSATSISGSSGTSPTPTHVSPLASLSPACIDTGSKDAEYYLFCYGMVTDCLIPFQLACMTNRSLSSHSSPA